MANTSTLQTLFDGGLSEAKGILDRARLCAAMVKPWILPDESQQPDAALPENYQSVGSRGLTNVEGKSLLAIFPPFPWFGHELAPEIEYGGIYDEATLQEMKRHLWLQDMALTSLLESANHQGGGHRQRRGFRTRKRMALSQVLITGDVLEYLDSDYRLMVFRRDQYITKRDSAGDVLYHITRQKLDPLGLEEGQISAAKLDRAKLEQKDASERMIDFYTRVQWQPWTRTWIIHQELNDQIVNESEETISPYFSTPFELVSGENYGRGLVELNIGDLRSLNELEERRLDMLGLASKGLIARDYNSMVREEDLEKQSGSSFLARVQGGQVQDVAMISFSQQREYGMINHGIDAKTSQLAKAFLIESELQPDRDRVTRYQVQRLAQELEDSLGGLYASIAEDQQLPLVQRARHQAERDNLLPILPKDAVRLQVLTGLNAIKRQMQGDQVMQLAQVVSQLGQQALRKIDMNVLIDVMYRYNGVHEPGLIRSTADLQREDQQVLAQQAKAAATGQAIQSAGRIAETAAANQIQNQQTAPQGA